MKKLLLTIMMILFLVTPCFAVGTISVSNDNIYGPTARVITITYTADAGAATIPSLTIADSTSGMIGASEPIAGWWLWKVQTMYGSVGPTDNSDLDIYNSWQSGSVFDLLGGNGENSIDNATANQVYPSTSTQLMCGGEVVTISNNAVNSATGTIYLLLNK